MIAVDTNLLVYAHREDAPWHKSALDTLIGLAEGRATWAIPWPCAHEFIAIVTHPRIYQPPTPLPIALQSLEAWLASPSLVLLAEGMEYWQLLKRLAVNAKLSGPRIHDARIAALCLQHGVRELWSADRDFTAFPALKTRNPLVAGLGK